MEGLVLKSKLSLWYWMIYPRGSIFGEEKEGKHESLGDGMADCWCCGALVFQSDVLLPAG